MANRTLPPLAPGQAVWCFGGSDGYVEAEIEARVEGMNIYRVRKNGMLDLEGRPDIYRRPEDADALKARAMAQAAVLVDFAESLACAVEGETEDE